MRDKAPKLALLLRRLLTAVNDVKEAVQGQSKAISAANEQARQEKHPPPEMRAEIRFPENVERDNAGRKEKEYSLQKRSVVIAAATFVTVFAYAGIAAWQLCVMRKATQATEHAAIAATNAAVTAEKQLEMSERPWIVSEYAPSAPLKFTPDGGATFGVEGKTTNIGHSVALFVHDTPLITLRDPGLAGLHPTDVQKDACDRIREVSERIPASANGDTLFPNQSSLENMPLNFSREDVEKARIGKTNTIIGLVVIGCVDYAFSFSPKHHQTGYVYEIVRPAPGGIGALPIKIGETLQPNQLIIRRSLFGGFYAD